MLVEAEPHRDERGYFARMFCEDEFANEGLVSRFPQTSHSFNARAGTVRGMHFQQEPHAETKLVRCIRGAIFDVVVDLRQDQPTCGSWIGFELSAENACALYIPEGLAHGFQTLADESEVAYAITPKFQPGAGAGIRWDDPAVRVKWKLPVAVISDKDRTWPLLESART